MLLYKKTVAYDFRYDPRILQDDTRSVQYRVNPLSLLRTFSKLHSASSNRSASQSFCTHKIFPDDLTGCRQAVQSFQSILKRNNCNESVIWRPCLALCKIGLILSQSTDSLYHELDPFNNLGKQYHSWHHLNSMRQTYKYRALDCLYFLRII